MRLFKCFFVIFFAHSGQSISVETLSSLLMCDISFRSLLSFSPFSFFKWITFLCFLKLFYVVLFPHSGHLKMINVYTYLHFIINSSIFVLMHDFSRNVSRSLLNSSFVTKQTFFSDSGISFKMFAASVWWETACSLKMSTLSEQYEHILHLNSFRNGFFFSLVVLHSPNQCFMGTAHHVLS